MKKAILIDKPDICELIDDDKQCINSWGSWGNSQADTASDCRSSVPSMTDWSSGSVAQAEVRESAVASGGGTEFFFGRRYGLCPCDRGFQPREGT